MVRMRSFVFGSLALLAVGLSLTGCPYLGDYGVQLSASPKLLEFGSTVQSIDVDITKNASQRKMGPAVITALEPWIEVDSCGTIGDGCVSTGPLDPIHATIRVNRGHMTLGSNSGSVFVKADGAATIELEVRAEAVLVPDFTAGNRTPNVGTSVLFTDRTQSALPSTEPIVSRVWDFGDGTHSTGVNPTTTSHVYTHSGVYTVALTVTTGFHSETTTKTDFLVVGGARPVADFGMSASTIYQGESVAFTDLTVGIQGSGTTWAWDFGDGSTSTLQNPVHTFRQSGLFNVSLAVSNGFGADTHSAYVLVKDVTPPRASFNVSSGYVGDTISFTDTSVAGSAPITQWRWDFGDGALAAEQNPTHIYTQQALRTVTLTVYTAHGQSQATRLLSMVHVPLQANFEVDKRRALVGEGVTFTDTSVHGAAPIQSWFWEFGDGSTSTLQAPPAHQYATPGLYTVRLRVQTAYGINTANKPQWITVTDATPLDNFMLPVEDPVYSLQSTATVGDMTQWVLKLTSQQWRTAQEVNKPTWNHWLTIAKPAVVTNSRAILVVSGGSNTSPAPSEMPTDYAALASATGSVVAILPQVPSERLYFADDPNPLFAADGRSEDEIISYSYWKYLLTGDETWPLLFPMAKSAVRAMDAIQAFMRLQATPVIIDDFVVTGASKRGWTTWLTAAADTRVAAIAPIVIDVLNMPKQMDHHVSVYGAYSEEVHDYIDFNIFSRLESEASRPLMQMVDPFSYVSRLTMPKLLINAAGDEFFCADSAQFYFHELLGENYTVYVPNAGHDLNGYAQGVFNYLVPWYLSLLPGGDTRPQFSWNATDTSIAVSVDQTPSEILLWTATSDNKDFRYYGGTNTHLSRWTSTPLSPSGVNRYLAEPVRAQNAWTAFFVELKFANSYRVDGQAMPFRFTTETRIAPPLTAVAPRANFTVDLIAGQMYTLNTTDHLCYPPSSVTAAQGQPVVFSDWSFGGTSTITSWLWTFGDGSTSTDRLPTHAYAAPGSYTVSLKVTSLAGTSTKTRTGFIVVPAPANP